MADWLRVGSGDALAGSNLWCMGGRGSGVVYPGRGTIPGYYSRMWFLT